MMTKGQYRCEACEKRSDCANITSTVCRECDQTFELVTPGTVNDMGYATLDGIFDPTHPIGRQVTDAFRLAGLMYRARLYQYLADHDGAILAELETNTPVNPIHLRKILKQCDQYDDATVKAAWAIYCVTYELEL